MLKNHLLSALALVVFGALAAGSADSGSSPASTSTSTTTSASPAAAPPQTKAEYVQQVDRELESLKTFDGGKYRSSKDEILIETALFGAWAQLIRAADGYSLTLSERSRVLRLKQRVSQVQIREFPRMRAAWTRILADAVWEHDMTVTAGGEANRTLRLTSVVFASNGNIAEIQRTVHDPLELLRFKRVEYRWYRGADEYTYYRVETPPDGAVRQISGNGWSSQ